MSNSCCSTNATDKATAMPPSAQKLLGASSDDLAECPVMTGSQVVKADAESAGLFRDYEGNRYWFCCAGCGPLFDATPAKYATAA
ncbi:YHS domain-containing protein [Cryobacterium melibiosiphilum]|uniref:YHS domain-containing protein n=2 Tax=Cryobacterium TaxID=69578 RepID=A0A4R8ZXJ0_9MICO|nr:YHS domain-containing protein [Cryobacterium melibiosiphilum]TFD48482.1 YHS domain-containing protein [Cryobacterium frigoriphilum]